MQEIRYDYDLCIQNPEKYQRKVDSISDMFDLKGKSRLKGDSCPVYIVGKYRTTPIFMFGLNPGYSLNDIPRQETEARRSWNHYQDLYFNFF